MQLIDATRKHLCYMVSILTRPWGRVQRGRRFGKTTAASAVSILTRPWGRVQCDAVRDVVRYARFQSSPARGGGCNAATSASVTRGSRFQSSPARGGGCNALKPQQLAHGEVVSILTRPWGRVQRGLENARERFPKRKCSSCQGVPCRALGG